MAKDNKKIDELDNLKQRIASCRRIYKYLDGSFGIRKYGGQLVEKVEAKPAWREPMVIIVNQNPPEFVDGDRRIVLDDILHKLTMEELDYVMPLRDGSYWSEIEAQYFAATVGSIYRYGAYVLGNSHSEVFGDRNGLREGKLAVAVEFYDILGGKNDRFIRKKS